MCGSFPVPCPNQCGSTIQRQNIDSHVADECPLTTINCDFHHVGCAVKLPRQDMPEHQRENLLTHISLLATSHAKQQDKIANLVDENDKQQKSYKTNLTALQTKVTALEQEKQLLNTNAGKQQVQLAPCTTILLGPPVLTITNFQQHKRDADIWYSPPVYTHHQGYKICLRVDANGDGTAKGTHVSVFVYLMRGEFDDFLKWPFRGVMSIELLDQVNGKDNKTDTITYDDKTPNKYCIRVTEGERSLNGWGHTEFIAHTELEPKYLRNDTLLFQIHKVELN